MNTNNTTDLTPHFALDGDQPFKDRRAMMPFRGAIPVAKEQLAQTRKRCSIKRYHHVSDWFIYTFLFVQHTARFVVFIRTVLMKMRVLIIPTP